VKISVVILAFVICCGFACENENDCVTFKYDTDEVFRNGVVYCPADFSFQLTVEDIQDSRCPEGVVCVWQGEVTVKLSIDSGNEETLVLSSYHVPVDTLGNHQFSLMEVYPYPKYKQPLVISDYRIKIRVENL
jgi:hypothetical protein